MKKYYKYLAVVLLIVLNIHSYIISYQTPANRTITEESNWIFYDSKSIVSSSINFSTLLASFGLILIIVSIFLKINFWKHFTAFFMLAGLTSHLQFWTYNYYIGLGIFKVEVVTLFILLIHLKLNPTVLADLKSFFATNKDGGEASLNEHLLNENLVKIYKAKFKKLTTAELDKIVADNKHSKEAQEAAMRLLGLDKDTSNS